MTGCRDCHTQDKMSQRLTFPGKLSHFACFDYQNSEVSIHLARSHKKETPHLQEHQITSTLHRLNISKAARLDGVRSAENLCRPASRGIYKDLWLLTRAECSFHLPQVSSNCPSSQENRSQLSRQPSSSCSNTQHRKLFLREDFLPSSRLLFLTLINTSFNSRLTDKQMMQL